MNVPVKVLVRVRPAAAASKVAAGATVTTPAPAAKEDHFTVGAAFCTPLPIRWVTAARSGDSPEEVAARDNVVLLHQPEETITGGYLTLRRYASDESGQEDDPVHKSTEFAAMMVNRFLDLL